MFMNQLSNTLHRTNVTGATKPRQSQQGGITSTLSACDSLPSASDSFLTLALYKFIYLLTYLLAPVFSLQL